MLHLGRVEVGEVGQALQMLSELLAIGLLHGIR
jgi:hypothetical protein